MLYGLSNVLYSIVYYIARYRRKVVRRNLVASFPEWQHNEVIRTERRYYHHLCDLFVESLYGLRATPKQLIEHYRITNRELLDRYYEQGQSVMLMSAHYNNWEYLVLSLGFQVRHHGIGVGKPLDQQAFGKLLTASRTRYGTEVVDQTNVRQVMAFYDQYHVPCAYMMLSDQSPSNAHKSFWTHFLHQDTPFLYGTEYFARKYDYPVLYYTVSKVRRGFYELTLGELCTDPRAVPEGTITQCYVKWLEETIRRQPEYWLWSHRRWKLRRDGSRRSKQEYLLSL